MGGLRELTKLEERLKALGVEGGCSHNESFSACGDCEYDWGDMATCEGYIMGKLLDIIEYQKDVIEKMANDD